MIEDRGVLSIPVEELRMENLPRPDRSGQVVFKEKKRGRGKQIESFSVVQTIENLNELIRDKRRGQPKPPERLMSPRLRKKRLLRQ